MGVQDVQADHVASHLVTGEGRIVLTAFSGSSDGDCYAAACCATPAPAEKGLSYFKWANSSIQMRLPLDVCATHKLSQEDVLRGKATEALRAVVHQVASSAVVHLNTGNRL